MRPDLSDIIKGFDPDKDVQQANHPTPEPRLRPIEPLERLPIVRRRAPGEGKPRESLQGEMLKALIQGPVTLSKLMKMAGTKRSYYSRSSEMRIEGLIEDTVTLTDKGREAAQRLLDQQEAWDKYVQARKRKT